MEEFEPIKKTKYSKLFYFKYVYVIALALISYLSISYSLTFFKQNMKVADANLTTATVTIELDGSNSSVTSSINATGLDKTKPLEFSKSIVVENTSSYNGLYTVSLERTSGLNLTDMKYSVSINGVIKEIKDVPSNGLILSSAIMAGETDNVEVRLWPKDDYAGSETTFVGNLTLARSVLSMTGSGYIDTQTLTSSNNYVYFNCTNKTNINTCEKWRIVGTSGGRMVLTTDTYYGNTFTNSNLFNTTLALNDYSLVTSMSTDNHAVYLKKTVEIIGGDGTSSNPYILTNNDYNPNDEKVIAYITYDNDGTTTQQPIYYGRDNYISQSLQVTGFQGWSTTDGGDVDYVYGDKVTFSSNTTLYAVIKTYLKNKIMQLCNDSNVTYVQPYTSSLGITMDTYDGRGTEDVCYYTSADSNDLAGANGNVIFGDYCWQIVRTTDNGGVKLIYNGIADNGQCLTTRGQAPGIVSQGVSETTMTGAKLYGTKFERFNDNGTNKFRLLNSATYDWNGDEDSDGILDYHKIIGTYTCLSSSNTCTTLYYVGHYIDSVKASLQAYVIYQNQYQLLAKSGYNAYEGNLASVGYMYDDTPFNVKSKTDFSVGGTIINILSSTTSASTSYYFGDMAVWNSATNQYDLKINTGTDENPIYNDPPSSTTVWSSIRNNAKGKYTCRSSTSASCSSVYYIVTNATGTIMYSILLSNNEKIDDKIAVVGTGFSKNNGIYTLTGTSTIYLKNWYDNYNNASYKNVYICNDYTSTSCSTLYYITSTDRQTSGNLYQIKYNTSVNNYYFSNSVEYVNGSYRLLDTNTNNDHTKYQQIWDWNAKYNTIENSHYTCFNTSSDNCGNSVYYVFSTVNDKAYYIELTNGETVETALKKMINYKQSSNEIDDEINKYNSAIKGIVDNFYETGLSNTAKSYLDSSIMFCNDRSLRSFTYGNILYGGIGGWNPTGGSVSSAYQIFFKNMYRNGYNEENKDLSCLNLVDRFSTENEKAELVYPIGILTEPEENIAGNYYLKTKSNYGNDQSWTMSPFSFAIGAIINVSNNLQYSVTSLQGVRPVISLKQNIEITGTGTYIDPYVVVGSNT